VKLALEAAVAATGARLLDADAAPAQMTVSTDTRTLTRGDAFVALRGERFDGHDYVAEGVSRGAAVLVVDRESARVPGVATMIVEETTAAYMALAAVARAQFKGRVLAITGSAGKTTTKDFAAQLLAGRFGSRVLAPPANENNEIGVSKLLLAASNDEHDAIVVEMGARKFGDVAALVEIARPDVGVLTNIGEAHLEIFGSRERLAETKWAIFSGGARAVVNADDEASVVRAPSLDEPPRWFAARAQGEAVPQLAGRVTALVGRSLLADGERADSIVYRSVDVNVPGAHNLANAAAAIAGARELGVGLDAIAEILPSLRLPPGRFESLPMAGGWRIIYDAYNANASGTIAALDALLQERPERAIAVLASMAELGEESVALHEEVGAHAATRAAIVLVTGEYADALARGARRGGLGSDAIVRVASNGQAARWLRANARRGDAVLLKGSRKYRLEEILEELAPS
jgi:UDP-N-acetylmuramoyl-tripeptide--D-alanyl-D-alanine ligase